MYKENNIFKHYFQHQNIESLLFQLFFQLLLVILQIHDWLLSKFQVTLQLPLGSFQIHTDLLLLLQWTFQLKIKPSYTS